ncbi:unnamed protein product [Clonostachys solani]|uniref:Uncharacterized protein n=1 Tax=Clonostachys solani TaxID=160281 RepID=A0A9N9W2S4_9HYPO|nr:unnamed protein product [Clonostachys solani]
MYKAGKETVTAIGMTRVSRDKGRKSDADALNRNMRKISKLQVCFHDELPASTLTEAVESHRRASLPIWRGLELRALIATTGWIASEALLPRFPP